MSSIHTSGFKDSDTSLREKLLALNEQKRKSNFDEYELLKFKFFSNLNPYEYNCFHNFLERHCYMKCWIINVMSSKKADTKDYTLASKSIFSYKIFPRKLSLKSQKHISKSR